MATTGSQNSSVPFDDAYNNAPLSKSNNGSTRSSSTRSRRMSVGGDIAAQSYGSIPPMAPAAPEVPKGPPVSYRNGAIPPDRADLQYRNDVPISNIPRSFSARSRNQPPPGEKGHPPQPQNAGYDDNMREASNENVQFRRPSGRRASIVHPTTTYADSQPVVSNSSVHRLPVDQLREKIQSETYSQPTSGSQASPVSRSSTIRSSKGDKSALSSERSPLQQLETRFVGMSKEEKRARMMEAEKRLREKIARRESLRDSSASQPSPNNSKPEVIEGRPKIEPASTNTESSPDQQYQRRQPSISRKSIPPEQVRFPTVQAANEPQYALAQDSQGSQSSGLPSQQRQPSRSQRHSRGYSVNVSAPENGQIIAPTSNYRDAQNAEVYNAPLPSQNNFRTRGIPAQDLSRSEYDSQRPMTSAGRPPVPMPTAQNNGHVASYNEQTFLERDTGVGPANFADEALNATPDEQHHESIQSREESASSLKKSKRQTVSFDIPPPTPPPLHEWRNAPVARLRLTDREFKNVDVDKGKAWWERDSGSKRRQSRVLQENQRKPTPKINERNRFNPALFLKCGPLLRYLGIKKTTTADGPHGPTEQEVWRGSVMIVTTDSLSSLETPPTLRLFSQPMDLLPPPPQQINDEEGAHLDPAYVDPIAGLVKQGRDGRTLYVKPVDHLEEGVDLSTIESEDGLFESSPSPIDYDNDGQAGSRSVRSNRLHSVNGENSGLYEEIQGFRLYSDPSRDVTFWRFNIEVELSEKQERIAYRINEGPAIGFWVPAKGQSMNIMFHSCNGFSMSVDNDKFSGPDPLWRDVLNEHQTRPFHVMIGGGDQIYCDKVMQESDLFEEWTHIKNPQHKHNAPFSPELKAELETFYLNHYAFWFSHGLFSLANCQIPMVNIWDDHDIIDGFGSYPDHLMSSPVFSGLGNIAFKYYMLFQHQSLPEETDAEEPSWLLGADPGPYIKERSRNLFMSFGKGVSFLGIDCRTERMREEIVSEQTYDLIWDRCYREIMRGEVKHLIVLLGVPIAYPRLVWLENILSSRAMDPVKALTRAGLFSNLVNKFDGSIEVLDDVDDHWTAKHHKTERTMLIEDLQDLAAEKSVRVTILSGDVHLAAIGQFYSNPTLSLTKDKDYRYMPNVISSAIVNAPPPEMLADFLNRRNKIHHMDSNTDEDMIPIFTHDVDGKNRNNKRLLPRRNWCSIREYHPGTTPPPTPPTPAESPDAAADDVRPGLLRRTLSLSRGESQRRPQTGGLLRRLSGRGPPPTREFNLENAQRRRFSMDNAAAPTQPPPETGDSYFANTTNSEDFRPGPFHRRATDLSTRSAKRANGNGDENAAGGFVNLEGGLDITLNLEVNPKDPAGITTPYKLLVPALWYDGGYGPEPHRIVKGWRRWLGRGRPKRGQTDPHDQEEPQEQPIYPDHPQQHEQQHTYDDEDDDDEHYYDPQGQDSSTPNDYPRSSMQHSDSDQDTPPKRRKWLGIV